MLTRLYDTILLNTACYLEETTNTFIIKLRIGQARPEQYVIGFVNGICKFVIGFVNRICQFNRACQLKHGFVNQIVSKIAFLPTLVLTIFFIVVLMLN